MRLPLRLVLITLFIGGFCNSCGILKNTFNKAEAITQCSFKLEKIEKRFSFTEHTSNIFNYVVEIDFACINPTKENITLGGYKLDLYANGKWIGDIATPIPLQLNANATTPIYAKTIISPSGVFGVFFKKLFGERITYTVMGTFTLSLGVFSYPFQVQLLKVVEK